MLDYFRKNNFPLPSAICDNDRKKQGATIEDLPIISFEYALENCNNLNIIITSYEYANEIAEQVLEKLDDSAVLNIRVYFDATPENQLAISREEFIEKRKLYVASLRGENNEKFELLKPSDMPYEAKKIVEKLESYRNAYARGEDLIIDKDDFWIIPERNASFWKDFTKNNHLIDFIDQGNYNNIYKSKNYKGHFFEMHKKNPTFNIAEKIESVTGFSTFLEKKKFLFYICSYQVNCQISILA